MLTLPKLLNGKLPSYDVGPSFGPLIRAKKRAHDNHAHICRPAEYGGGPCPGGWWMSNIPSHGAMIDRGASEPNDYTFFGYIFASTNLACRPLGQTSPNNLRSQRLPTVVSVVEPKPYDNLQLIVLPRLTDLQLC